MAGTKGHSGRKALTNDELRARVIDRSWKILEDAYDSPELTINQKAEIAKTIAAKSIPQNLNHAGNITIINQAPDLKSTAD